MEEEGGECVLVDPNYNNMAKDLTQLKNELFEETDGNKFARLKDKLIRTLGADALPVLIAYTKEGKLLHWRNFLLTDILNLVNEGDAAYADYFSWAVTQPGLAYWSVDGLLKTKGDAAYEQLTSVALDGAQTQEVRAKAIKSLAVHSRQPFDRSLPADPGHWKKEQLRLDEVIAWQQSGFPKGEGYVAPAVHPSLQRPVTDLEKAAAKLEKKLKKEREKRQDPASPSNWLTIADAADMDAIQQRWKLPEPYLNFLRNYSPLNVFIDSRKFFQGLHLYGAKELISRQDGYSFNPVKNQPIADWPSQYVVIADAGGDPYCIDLNSPGAAVYTSMHGTGKWEFELYADSFIKFLQQLA